MLTRTMVNAVAVTLTFVVPISRSVDELSDMAVVLFTDMFSDVLTVVTGSIFSVVVDMLLDVNANVFVGVMTEIYLVMPAPIDNFSCLAAFDCRSMAALDCDHVLHAWMPSYHVWSSLALPTTPQFPNQEPPRPQQLTFPDVLTVPHRGHTKPIAVVVTARVYV